MNEELFNELVESVREGGAILRGEVEPSRIFVMDVPDVKRIRLGYNLTQSEFASLLGISVKTLRHWEQGRGEPHGAARVLLQVAQVHPKAVWEVVRPTVRHVQSSDFYLTFWRNLRRWNYESCHD